MLQSYLRVAEYLMLEGDRAFKETHAEKTGRLLEHIRVNAEQQGLMVNEKKTVLMCVSAAKSFEPRVSVTFNGQAVRGVEKMKILGVTLDSDCGFSSHVDSIAKRLRKKTWTLSRLRRKGMAQEDLVQAYASAIRPVAEYASPVWHPLLTVGQSETLERQQVQALKNIYGVGMSARKMRAKSGLDRLWARRETACQRFAKKNLFNARCAGWFELRENIAYPRRAGTTYRTYKEPLSRTDRHRNSPVNYARRILNKI